MNLNILMLHLVIFILAILVFIIWFVVWKRKKQYSKEESPSMFDIKLRRIEKRLEKIRHSRQICSHSRFNEGANW